MSKKFKIFVFSSLAFCSLFAFNVNSFAQGKSYDDAFTLGLYLEASERAACSTTSL